MALALWGAALSESNNVLMVPTFGHCSWTAATTFGSTVPVSAVAAGHCLLWQNVDHHGSSMIEKYIEEPLLALKSRSEDDWSLPGFSGPHRICLI